MKKKFKAMYHQIEQLKEEIKEKDADLIRKHCEHHKVIKQYEKIRDVLGATKKRQTQLASITDLQKKEIRKIELVRHSYNSYAYFIMKKI